MDTKVGWKHVRGSGATVEGSLMGVTRQLDIGFGGAVVAGSFFYVASGYVILKLAVKQFLVMVVS